MVDVELDELDDEEDSEDFVDAGLLSEESDFVDVPEDFFSPEEPLLDARLSVR